MNVQGNWIGDEWDTKTHVVKVYGDPTGSDRNHCKTKSLISKYTFLIHMLEATLKVTLGNAKVSWDMGLILPCALKELSKETTSLYP